MRYKEPNCRIKSIVLKKPDLVTPYLRRPVMTPRGIVDEKFELTGVRSTDGALRYERVAGSGA